MSLGFRHILPVLVLGLAACSNRTPEHTHAKREREVSAPAAAPELLRENFPELKANASAEEIAAEVRPLALRVLSAESLSNPRYRSGDGRTDLERLNLSLLAYAEKLGPEKFALSEEAKNYRAKLEEGCRPGTIDFCKNLELFRLDGRTASVAKALALGEKDVRAHYRLLRFAVELGADRLEDHELDSLFVARSMELFQSYAKVSTIGTSGRERISVDHLKRAEIEELRVHVDFVATKLLTGAGSGNVDLSGILRQVVSGNLAQVLGPKLASGYTKIIATHLKEGALWEEFKAMVAKGEAALPPPPGPNADPENTPLVLAPSYSFAARDLGERGKRLQEMLGLSSRGALATYTERDDIIYFYVISRLFASDPIEAILPLWQATKRDGARFQAILEDYIRVYLGHTAVESNLKIAAYFRRIRTVGVDQKALLTKAMDSVKSDVTPTWKDFFRRVSRVRTFHQREIEPGLKGRTDAKAKTELEASQSFFNELGRNVKYIVTYPNLLMFAYYAKKYDYREHYDFFLVRGGITIDANLIIQEMMNGKVPPLFVFTADEEDYKGISRFEMNYALYYAIRGGLLELYQVDATDWYRKISDAYLAKSRDRLRKWAGTLHKLRHENNYYADLETTCRIASGKSRGDTFPRPTLLTIDGLRENTLTGGFNGNNSRGFLDDFIANVFVYGSKGDNQFAEPLELVRSDVNPALRNLKLIRSLFATSGASPEVLGEIDRTVAESDRLRKEVVGTIRDYDMLARTCMFDLVRLEESRQYELFMMERDFQTHVHLALHALNTLREKNNASVAELRASTAHPIWNDPFFANLDPALPLFEATRVLLNERSGLGYASRTVRDYGADLAQNGGIQPSPNGGYAYIYRRTDLLLRFLSFAVNGYNGKGLSFRGDAPTPVYPDTLRELNGKAYGFATPQIREMQASVRSDVSLEDSRRMFLNVNANEFEDATAHNWFFDKYGSIFTFRSWLRMSATLYKTLHSMDVDPNSAVKCDADCRARERASMEKEAAELVRLNAKIFDFANIGGAPARSKELLKIFDTQSFYTYMIPAPIYLFVDPTGADQRHTGIADEAFNLVVSQHLGVNPSLRDLRPNEEFYTDPMGAGTMNGNSTSDLTQDDFTTRTRPFEDAKEAFKSTLERQKETLLFPIDQEVLAGINATFIESIATEFRLADVFIKTAESELPKLNIQPAEFHLYEGKFTHPYWITPSLLGGYYEEIRRFNAITQNKFLPAEFQRERRWTPLAESGR